MRTRSQSRNLNRQQQQAPPAFVEPFNLEEPIENPAPPVVTMDDNRTMAQLLEAPTEGYEDAIVVPEITADNFELKHGFVGIADNTGHTMAEHSQVGCRLLAVEHCKPQPCAQTLPGTCPNDMTAYTPFAVLRLGVSPNYSSYHTNPA
ncbi:hypothetical protein Tco_1264484 [Tanacetum coccineum]